ncbi:MAG: hypothetical protein ACIAS6_10700 [Phycisphaerales bacterium JB060]
MLNPPPVSDPQQLTQVLTELRHMRVGLEHLNKRTAGQGAGVEVRVFWKLVWAIIVAQLLMFLMVMAFWLIFAVLIGGAMAAGAAGVGGP